MDTDALIPLGILVFVAFLIWIHHNGRLQKRRLMLEEQNRLLDRIGTGDSMVEFLKTEQRQAIPARLNDPEDRQGMYAQYTVYQMSVIGLVIAGVITTSVGIGFLFAASLNDWDFVIPAFTIGGLGCGCLITAWIQYRPARKWGMFGDGSTDNDARARQS
jgi:hypothetical protein